VGFDGGEFPGHVTAAERRVRAARHRAALARTGLVASPVELAAKEIACTFWGQAWCRHLEALADLATRLPRGRSYLRSGAVVHLALTAGEIRAFVSGTELYEVRVAVAPLPAARWDAVRRACAGRIATVVELLSGRLASAVMEVLCDPDAGLFPRSSELGLSCSCPDGARLCKHLAAVLYGVGARLDTAPELLFTLRGVKVEALAAAAEGAGALTAAGDVASLPREELGRIFGIDLAPAGAAPRDPSAPRPRPRPAPRRTSPRRGGGRATRAPRRTRR
jgi:uncharacterized Zn finger protein